MKVLSAEKLSSFYVKQLIFITNLPVQSALSNKHCNQPIEITTKHKTIKYKLVLHKQIVIAKTVPTGNTSKPTKSNFR